MRQAPRPNCCASRRRELAERQRAARAGTGARRTARPLKPAPPRPRPPSRRCQALPPRQPSKPTRRLRKAERRRAGSRCRRCCRVPPAVVEPVKPVLRVDQGGGRGRRGRAACRRSGQAPQGRRGRGAAIRAMMNAPKKVLTPRSPKRRPSRSRLARMASRAPSTSPKRCGRAPAPGAVAKPGDKKSVKSEKLSSSWADDAAKKRAPRRATMARPVAMVRAGWRAPRGGRRGERSDAAAATSRRPPSSRSRKCTCPRPSAWPTWRTRCR
jgi:translation initiation factor IF-2